MKINFIPSSEEFAKLSNIFKPETPSMPKWYKDVPTEYIKNPKINRNGEIINTDLKMCIPFLDATTIGYVQNTWCDIYIEKIQDGINFYYSGGPQIMDVRENASLPFLDNSEFYNVEFVWKMPWIYKTPKGYSVIISNPPNRIDLPFYTTSGLVDSDIYNHFGPGNLPFYIKKNFSGLIPKGTPMYNVLPIKRESWKSEVSKFDILKSEEKKMIQRQFFWGFYKKKCWKKKEFK